MCKSNDQLYVYVYFKGAVAISRELHSVSLHVNRSQLFRVKVERTVSSLLMESHRANNNSSSSSSSNKKVSFTLESNVMAAMVPSVALDSSAWCAMTTTFALGVRPRAYMWTTTW